jgi:seryl-tRNA synthetase
MRGHLCADKGGDPEIVRESQRRRFADPGIVDEVIELDGKWRQGELHGEHACAYSNLCLYRFSGAGEQVSSGTHFVESCAHIAFDSGLLTLLAAQYRLESINKESNDLSKQVGQIKKVSHCRHG